MKHRFLALILFLVSFGFYSRQASPGVTAGDAGEFMTAAATLSLPHAPSFPFYTLASRSFISLVPWASFPYRCNLFSTFTSAICLVILFWIALEAGVAVEGAVLVCLAAGLGASFWENSLVTEVFSLNALFVTALFWCLMKAQKEGLRFYCLFFFLLGIGLGNHQVLLFMAPAFAVSVALASKRRELLRKTWLLALFGLLGFSVYLFLSVRSFRQPPLNWGQPTTVAKWIRSVTRKDYGSLNLALGEAPPRTFRNTLRHAGKFFRRLGDEIPWPAILLGLTGFIWSVRKKDLLTLMALSVFVMAGPFFEILGNLPFNAQSDGIIGRFYIMPVLALVLGVLICLREKKWAGISVLGVSLFLSFHSGWAETWAHRNSTLVLDYGRAMLRTLPPGSALFMDGGDDAFYSLAVLHEGQTLRPDVELHDRGGLVFKNPYGNDFRSLTKEEKRERRWQVEKDYLTRRPVFYSTMDPDALPGVRMAPAGFLMKAVHETNQGISWPLIILRSLYPLKPTDYRTRALAAFFPFMQGRIFLKEQKFNKALFFFRRAEQIGFDVDWLKTNLGAEYAHAAYNQLVSGNFAVSEMIYRQWIAFDPRDAQAQSNLGVVFEKSGRTTEAREQYKKAAALFQDAADPVFNLAVLAWKERDWPNVVQYLEEVLRRRPDHLQARGYLNAARAKLAGKK